MSSNLSISQDLRLSFGQIRDQGRRPLCLAFAASDLNAFSNNTTSALSVESLAYFSYKRDGHQNYHNGLTVEGVIEALGLDGQYDEHLMPYEPTAFAPAIPPKKTQPTYFVQTRKSNNIVASLNTQLNNGRVCVVCIYMPSAFFTLTHPFQINEESDTVGNHAVIVIGKASHSDGSTYYLIRNSWGSAWADNGHCWLSEQFLEKRTFAILEV